MAKKEVKLIDGADTILPQSLYWKEGRSWEDIAQEPYLLNALNSASNAIVNAENRKQIFINEIQTTGPTYSAIAYKFSNDYYSGIIWSYRGVFALFCKYDANTYMLKQL